MPDQLPVSSWSDGACGDVSSNSAPPPNPVMAGLGQLELSMLSSPPPASSLLLPFVDPPLLSCTMQKRSPSTPALWQVRHFILYPDLLLYSANSSPSSLSSPLGLIPLSSIIYVTSLPSSPLRFDFIVQADKSTHTFQLLTGSAELTSQWVRRMRRLTKAANAGRVGDEESSWYERKGKFWKNVTDLAMRRRVRRAHADYERSHPITADNQPSPTAPLLSGFIRKRSPALLQLWQSRYFVLYPAVIVYSRTMGSDMLGALAILSLVWMDKREECRLDISIEAEDGTGLGKERVMQLQMDSNEERDMWYSRISHQLSIIKHDHSSASHSRSMSAGGQLDHDIQLSELKQGDDVKPGSLLFSQQRKAHAHTPYIGAVTTSSAAVPSLQLQPQPHSISPPLPPQEHTKHHGLSPPSFLGKFMPASPLSVIKQSRHIAAQSKAANSSNHSVPASNTNMPLTATLSSITAPSSAAAISLLQSSSTRSTANSSTSSQTSSFPTTSSAPPMLSGAAGALLHDGSAVGLTTRSTSCYIDRPTSTARPLIKRLGDDNAHIGAAVSLDGADSTLSTASPIPLPAVSHKSEWSRSRSDSTSRSASSPPPPSGGLLDEGIILTLYRYTAHCNTLSLCDIVLAYNSDSHTLTCKPADAPVASSSSEQDGEQCLVAQQLVVGVDELQSASIGRQSDTMRRLSTHINAECCLTVNCADGDEINVVAKGAALIKLLHKELSILIGDLATDEQQVDSDSPDELTGIEQHADDKLDEPEGRADGQPTATLVSTPPLAPYLSVNHLVPILSTSPNLTRSRSAPVGATLRFQEKIEVHEYVQPASYTPSEEEDEQKRYEDDEHLGGLMLTYCQPDDEQGNTTKDEVRAAAADAEEYDLEFISDPPAAAAADGDIGVIAPDDNSDARCEQEVECDVTIALDIPVAPSMHSSLSNNDCDSSAVCSVAALERETALLDADNPTAQHSPSSTHLQTEDSSVDGERKRGKWGAPWNTAAASLAALMQGLANQNKPTLDTANAAAQLTSTLDCDTDTTTSSSSSSPTAQSSSATSADRDVSAATHLFGVRLRSVSSRSAATPASLATSLPNDTATNSTVMDNDSIGSIADLQLPDAPELAVSETIGADKSSNINLTVDFDADYLSPVAVSRSIPADPTSAALATAASTIDAQSLLSVAAASNEQNVVAADGDVRPAKLSPRAGGSDVGASPSHTSSIVIAPAARLLPSPASYLPMHRALSTPAAAAASSYTARPLALRQSVLPAVAPRSNQGAAAAGAIGGVSVSALKSLWQQKSGDSSPTAAKQNTAHTRR